MSEQKAASKEPDFLFEIIIPEDVVPRGDVDLKAIEYASAIPSSTEEKLEEEGESNLDQELDQETHDFIEKAVQPRAKKTLAPVTEGATQEVSSPPEKKESPPAESPGTKSGEGESSPQETVIVKSPPREKKGPPSSEKENETDFDVVRDRARNSIKASLVSGIQTLLSIIGALSLITLAGYGLLQYWKSPSEMEGNSLAISLSESHENSADQKGSHPKEKESSKKTQSRKKDGSSKTKKDNGEKKDKEKGPEKGKGKGKGKGGEKKDSESKKLAKLDPQEVEAMVSKLIPAIDTGLRPPLKGKELFQKGKEHEARGNISRARIYYSLASQAGNGAGDYRLGRLYQGENREKEALHRFRQAIDKGYESPAPYNNLTLIYLKQNKPEKAEEVIAQARKRNLESPFLLNTAGNLARKNKDLEKALQYYQQAIKVDPNFYAGYYNLAETLLLMGELDEALPHFEKVTTAPKKELAIRGWEGMGKIYLFKKKYDKARKTLEMALSQHSSPSPSLLENLAIAQTRSGHPQEALKIFQKLAKEEKLSSRMLYNRALVYMTLKKSDLAKKDLKKVLKNRPQHKSAHFTLAMISEKQGDFLSAIKHYEKTLEIDPGYAKAYNNLGLFHAQGGEFDKALSYYNKGIKVNPHFSPFYLNRGLVHLKAGHYQQGLKDLKKYLQIGQPSPRLKEKLEKLLPRLKKQVAKKKKGDR